jgi:alkaline phosphatase D
VTPLTRRQFLWTTAASSLAWPLLARQSLDGSAGGGRFQHGVASGDPLTDRLILWTRVTPADASSTQPTTQPISVRWRVALDPEMRRIVSSGTTQTAAARDYTVKVDVGGLMPGATYYYAFDTAGEQSPVGRTRTFPVGGADRMRFALVSCSNYPAGFFNVYRCLAKRPDLDAIVHVGDYIYEFGEGEYGEGAAIHRVPEPPREAFTLSDYRIRYATYRTDPDLQEAHRQFPFVLVWDDHEIANDAWSGGAANHNPEKGEGDYATRRAAAYKAYLEWMPIRESTEPGIHLYRTFHFGNLADLVMIDTRGLRDRQVAANNFAAITDPKRTLMGAPQEAWLFDQIRASKRADTPWTLLGQQIMFARVTLPGTPVENPDAWDGYQAQRDRVFDFLDRENVRNLVILTGDAHSSWGFDVPRSPWSGYRAATGEGSLAVELVTPAISSPTPAMFAPGDGRDVAAAIRVALPHLKFVDGIHRGFTIVDLTPTLMKADWYFVPDVRVRSDQEIHGASVVSERGSAHLQPA